MLNHTGLTRLMVLTMEPAWTPYALLMICPTNQQQGQSNKHSHS